MNVPFFSLVILGRGPLHLLSHTIESIKSQKEKDFEVIFISPSKTSLRLDPDVPVEWFFTKEKELAGMMNEGLSLTRGKYVQFLQPGDHFLSHEGLSHLHELIEKNHEPHLAYSGCLMKAPDEPPRALFTPLNRKTLQCGIFSSMVRSSWFQKEALVNLGGFDPTFQVRTAFDLFCRIYHKQKNLRIVYSPRILIDADPFKISASDRVRSFQETCQILYRYFGLKEMLRWVFIQDDWKLIKHGFRSLREVFRKS